MTGRLAAGLAVAGAVHCALNARLMRRPDASAAASALSVAVLVPARDEQATIGACLQALRAVRHDGPLRIVVLDDGSTDRTATVASASAQVITGAPLPPNWSGKSFACAQLADAVPDADVLVFVDADVRLAPDAVAAALDLLDRRGWDFCSPYPRQVCGSWAERVVQPLLQWSWLTTVPLRLAETGAFPSMGVANGQFLVVRRDAYDRAGGHAAVRADVVEDVALARALLRSGARGAVCDGSGLATCRMYVGAREVADGYAKSLWSAFGSPRAGLAVAAVLVWIYAWPVARPSRAGTVAVAAGVAGRAVAARASGGRVWPDSLAHPASVLACAGLTARSVLHARRGRLRWKGRPLAHG